MLKPRLAVIAVILLVGVAATGQATVSIEFAAGTFKVTGWRAPAAPPGKGWASIFAVYAGAGDVPPLAGTYTVEGGSLVFHPTYPIAPNVHYRAVFQLPGGGSPVEKTFDGPHQDKTPSARVERVYPSANVLPSNLLRLYVYFSAPMSRGQASQRIHVLDENGKVLQGARALFLPGEELWDPSYQRLTMTFDPGRIKRGLTSNQNIGPPIAEGKRYTLVIDRDWEDARGVPMVEGFRKSFRGGPADRNPPDPKQWQMTPPKVGTLDPLEVDFPNPMNYPLLQRMLTVSGAQGSVTGTVNIDHHEAQWRFTPHEPWRAGNYELVVDTALEDLAGNHIGQAFDIDTFERVTKHITASTISLPFGVR